VELKREKKGWKRPVLFTTILIGIFIIGFIIYLFSNLNLIVKRAIEKYGSQTTLTTVTVNKVNINLRKSSCKITNLAISNPRGFDKQKIFSVKNISVDFDILSIKNGEIKLKKIIIINPKIFVEINKKNKNNMLVLKHNLSVTCANSNENETDYKLHIKYLLIKESEISVLVVPLNNKSYKTKLPAFEMHNLRGTPSEISNQILNKIIKKVQKRIKAKGMEIFKSKVKERINSVLQKQKDQVLEKLKDKMKLL